MTPIRPPNRFTDTRVVTTDGVVESTLETDSGIRSFKGIHSPRRRLASCAGSPRSRSHLGRVCAMPTSSVA